MDFIENSKSISIQQYITEFLFFIQNWSLDLPSPPYFQTRICILNENSITLSAVQSRRTHVHVQFIIEHRLCPRCSNIYVFTHWNCGCVGVLSIHHSPFVLQHFDWFRALKDKCCNMHEMTTTSSSLNTIFLSLETSISKSNTENHPLQCDIFNL